MAIVRCANGHFYDTIKTKECPYCMKRDKDNIEIQKNIGDIPQFRVQFDMDFHEEVTVAKPESGEIRLDGAYGRSPIAGLSAGNDPVTVGFFSKQQGKGYVTGWLVAREGPVKGRDYRIYHGMNWIGRSANMDICMSEDPEISASRHCAVVYDARHNRFYLARGNGSVTYLNGRLLKDSSLLELGDIITIGNSKFEFVPFCREGHIWTEEEEE